MLSVYVLTALLQSVGADQGRLEDVLVRSSLALALEDTSADHTQLDAAELTRTLPTHPGELFTRVPAAWISRGSGQESLVSLRSPVLTGAGACGAFQMLEDDVPIRPAGFCNVNQLFEINLMQASRVTVVRGPGVTAEGANALHGVFSMESVRPSAVEPAQFLLEAGSNDYARGAMVLRSDALALALNATDAGSFRNDEHHRHELLNAAWQAESRGFRLRTTLAWANLDQDTAGYVYGFQSYLDPVLRRQNLNPEAFRKASAARLVSHLSWDAGQHSWELIPYLRTSKMEFLQHFLPGTPLEHNGQDSAGFRLAWRNDDGITGGFDAEWAKGYLIEYQAEALQQGSAFLRETRPKGFHYDYEVTSNASAAWLQYSHIYVNNLRVTIGLRYETLRYDYRNHLPPGNTRDDGSECGFGGCLYTRPADRSDRFSEFVPELGLSFGLTDELSFRFRLARGFRPPQATELYRLQRGQQVSDLAPTTLDALELGMEFVSDTINLRATAFAMRKNHFVFRDANGYNVSDGRTRHAGVELDLTWQASEQLELAANMGWARHVYDFDRLWADGEHIMAGNEVDTAPNWLGSARAHWRPALHRWLELEWAYTGAYFMDAANRFRQPHHGLLNLRAGWMSPGQRHQWLIRATNLLDTRYAERADFAFGNFRYYPGAGRQFFIGWQYATR